MFTAPLHTAIRKVSAAPFKSNIAEACVAIPHVLRPLKEEFGDKLTIRAIDNSGQKAQMHCTKIEDLRLFIEKV